MNGIGTLRENSLHADLKQWYALPGDRIEERVGGFIIDLIRGEQLIEIQTRSFSAFKKKLARLLDEHPVHVIYPLTAEKWIVHEDEDGNRLTSRKSPKKLRLEFLFLELVRIPTIAIHPNFSLEVVYVREEEARHNDGKGSWRRKGVSITDRRLIEVTGSRIFRAPVDYLSLLPTALPEKFTTREVAKAAKIRTRLAGKMLYTLRQMGLLEVCGQVGRAYLYRRTGSETPGVVSSIITPIGDNHGHPRPGSG